MDEKTRSIGEVPASSSPQTVTEVRYGNAVLRRPLGKGGMGEVFLAFHEGFQTPVCVKLLPEGFKETALVDRFLREAQVAVRLDHPNIVRVHDVGRANGRVYMVMEYVEGQDLEAYASDHGGQLQTAEALALVAQAARGIAYAHAQGVIHRDIKPSNLVRRAKDQVVKVVDFGLARAAGFDALTNDQSALGTLPYMAYEQLLGSPGAPADVYALGVTLYRLLAGKLPVAGPVDEVLRYHREGTPVPLSNYRPTPGPLQALVSRMMAREASERPTAEEAAVEMEALLRDLTPADARPSEDALARMASELKGESPAGGAARGRRVTLLRLGAAAALVVAGLAAWRFLPRSASTTPATSVAEAKETMALGVLIRPKEMRSFARNDMLGEPITPVGATRCAEEKVRSGEGLRFEIVADAPRYVYVFGVDTAGEAACLFPDAFERLFADDVKAGKAVGTPPPNPLSSEGGTIYVPPIVTAPGGTAVAKWFTADQSTGKEWFLIASSDKPIAELEALRKVADLAKRGDEIKGLAARWEACMGAVEGGTASPLHHFSEERLVKPGLCRAEGAGRVVWTLTLDHQE